MSSGRADAVPRPLNDILTSAELAVLLDEWLPGKDASYAPPPSTLDGHLQRLVAERYPNGLFTHQTEAVQAALRGENVVMATATASGKSLAFALPALQKLFEYRRARCCLFVYPTKALASDQRQTLEGWTRDAGLGDVVRRVDGDVTGEDRDEALRVGRIILTNADLMHYNIRKSDDSPWREVFDNLVLVVLDESHVYRGAFGSNMAYLVRRLRQVASNHGRAPQFLAASATSRDPAEHLESLVGLPFTAVGAAADGSGQADRRVVMAVPATPKAHEDVAAETLALLVEGGHRFIAFVASRRGAELLMADLMDKHPDFAEEVLPYRAGYEAADRQAIEKALNSGSLQGVISTSALELGVDIANMDTCVQFGLPPSVMSFWQRAGRVGRERGRVGNVLVVPSSTAVDLYYQSHPDKLLARPLERLVVQLDNRQVVIGHFACARVERPKGSKYSPDVFDEDIFGSDFVEFARLVDELDLDEPVLISPEPHFDVGIRGIGDPPFDILNLDPRLPFDVALQQAQHRRLGTISLSQILREAYPRAIYWHMGQPYRVNRVKYHDQQVLVEKMSERQRRTFPMGEVRVTPKLTPSVNIFRQRTYGSDFEVWHTAMSVRTAVRGCREREGDRWVDAHVYSQPLSTRIVTEGVWLRMTPEFGVRTAEGLFAAANAIGNAYTIMKPCEPTDVAATAVMRSSDGSSRIYLYDDVAGGLAITQDAYDRLPELVETAIERLERCPTCVAEGSDAGCPACAQSSYSYENHEVSRAGGIDLLRRIAGALSEGAASREMVSETYKRRAEGMLSSVSADALREEVVRAEGSLARRYFPVGSLLRTATGTEGRVSETYMEGKDRVYVLDMETSPVPKLFKDTGMNLTLVEGELQKECLNCGQAGLDWDEDPCPNCGANVGMGSATS